jgi:iron only hydrogenase large subunit-like protein
MVRLRHAFRIDADKCDGRMSCMRACPTHAIRVKNGKARVISELCIDCGLCLGVCELGAISAETIDFAELDRYKFKVAVASPALFTQFGLRETPADVGRALLELGFDAVWEYAVDLALIDRAVTDFVKKWSGPFPLISSSCPVVVRLIQVSYPSLVDHVIPLEAPREIAARELKRKYSQKLGLKPEEIAAIYITPCQAKAISIIQPAEEAKSYLDGALGISEIYNGLLTKMRKAARPGDAPKDLVNAAGLMHWGAAEEEVPALSREHFLPLTGLTDIMKVFNDVEKGRIRGIEFLECNACQGGCIGGNLMVENLYAARSKNLHLMDSMPEPDPKFEKEVDRRYAQEDFFLRGSLKPRQTEGEAIDLRERVRRRKKAEEVLRVLPQLNCGLCGAPKCRNHAGDVAASRADLNDCVFLSPDRIQALGKLYKK